MKTPTLCREHTFLIPWIGIINHHDRDTHLILNTRKQMRVFHNQYINVDFAYRAILVPIFGFPLSSRNNTSASLLLCGFGRRHQRKIDDNLIQCFNGLPLVMKYWMRSSSTTGPSKHDWMCNTNSFDINTPTTFSKAAPAAADTAWF